MCVCVIEPRPRRMLRCCVIDSKLHIIIIIVIIAIDVVECFLCARLCERLALFSSKHEPPTKAKHVTNKLFSRPDRNVYNKNQKSGMETRNV